MEATLAVTLHLWRLERETMTSLTGAAEGEDPKCLRHTWLTAKLGCPPPFPDTSECRCELLYFMIFLTFTFWDTIWKDMKDLLVSLLRADLFFDTKGFWTCQLWKTNRAKRHKRFCYMQTKNTVWMQLSTVSSTLKMWFCSEWPSSAVVFCWRSKEFVLSTYN